MLRSSMLKNNQNKLPLLFFFKIVITYIEDPLRPDDHLG